MFFINVLFIIKKIIKLKRNFDLFLRVYVNIYFNCVIKKKLNKTKVCLFTVVLCFSLLLIFYKFTTLKIYNILYFLLLLKY